MITAGDPLGGSRIPQSLAYSSDRAAANNVLTIMVGHSLAVFGHHRQAGRRRLGRRRSFLDQISVAETGERVANEAPGQVAVLGRAAAAARCSSLSRGGNARLPRNRRQGVGDRLDTVDHSSRFRTRPWADWRIMLRNTSGATVELPAPSEYSSTDLSRPAANIARLYREIAAPSARPRRPPRATPRCASENWDERAL